jgi:hypothetical protein
MAAAVGIGVGEGDVSGMEDVAGAGDADGVGDASGVDDADGVGDTRGVEGVTIVGEAEALGTAYAYAFIGTGIPAQPCNNTANERTSMVNRITYLFCITFPGIIILLSYYSGALIATSVYLYIKKL